MKYSTHFIVGLTTGLLFARYLGGGYLLMGLAGALFGVLPDSDIILSKLYIAEHRGAYSHSLGSSLILGAAAGLSAYYLFGLGLHLSLLMAVLAALSSFLHVLADSMTYSGTYMLWPLSRRRYRGWVRYDSITANIGIISLCILSLYLAGFFGYLTEFHGW